MLACKVKAQCQGAPLLSLLQEHVPEPNTGVVAGNSVHVDVAFLKRHMPRLAEHLHYRWAAALCCGSLPGS